MIKPNAISVEDMHIFASLMQMHWQISGSGIKSHAGLAKKKMQPLQTNYLSRPLSWKKISVMHMGRLLLLNLLFKLYGEWLLAMNKPEEALQQFEQSPEALPGRILSVQGKDKAVNLLRN